MIIKSCYIENFGKISNKNFEFNSSLNVIKEDNGWGKSTLAMFIRSMFYGLEYKKTGKLYERNKYIPWQGGNFGGSLIFEVDSKEYMIERFFGEKSDKNDTFTLYNTKLNIESMDYTKNIGEEIFDVDRDSFDKSVFIALDYNNPEISDRITEKLNELVSKKKDTCNIEDTIKRLDKYSTQLLAKRGSGGELNLLKDNLNTVKNNIRSCKTAGVKAKIIENQISDSENEINKQVEISKKLNSIIASTTLYATKERYEKITNSKTNTDKKLSTLSDFFNNKIPQEEKIITDNVDRAIILNTLKGKLIEYGNIDEVYEEIKVYKSLFDADALSYADFDVCEDNLSQYNELLQKINNFSLSEEEKNRYISLNNKYGHCVELIKEIDAYISKYHDIHNLETNIKSKNENIELLQDVSKSSTINASATNKDKEFNNIFAKLGVLGILIGFIMAFVLPIVGIIFSVIGIGLIVTSFIIKKNTKKSNNEKNNNDKEHRENTISKANYNLQKEEENIEIIKLQKTKLENELNEFIKSIKGNYESLDTIKILNEIKEDFFTLNNLINKHILYKNTYKTVKTEMDECKRVVDVFLHNYRNAYPNYKEDKLLSLFRSNFEKYNLLAKKSTNYEVIKAQISEISKELDKFLIACNVDIDLSQIKQMEIVRDNYKEYIKTLKESDLINKELEEFIKNNDICSISNLVKPTVDIMEVQDELSKINERIQECSNTLTLQEQKLIEQYNILENLREYEDEEGNLNVKIEEMTYRKEIIDATIKYLEKSNENLAEAYMAPMNTAFNKYLSYIDTTDEKIKLDSKLGSVITSGAKSKSGEYYSSGYKDLITICTKLTLFDVIFKKEKPFIIFDDPFVNLDDDKINKGIDLIKKLSLHNQILYFTCHDSRIII